MRILGLNLSHDSSACVIENGKLIYYNQTERLNHKKHSTNIIDILIEAFRKCKSFDYIAICTTNVPFINGSNYPTENVIQDLKKIIYDFINSYYLVIRRKDKFAWIKNLKIVVIPHHFSHATNVFYQSGFKDAAVLVADGGGSFFLSEKGTVAEIVSSYSFFDTGSVCHFKKAYDYSNYVYEREIPYITSFLLEERYLIDDYPNDLEVHPFEYTKSIAHIFNRFAKLYGPGNPGTFMAMAAYGKDTGLTGLSKDGVFLDSFLDFCTYNVSKVKSVDVAYAVQEESYKILKEYITKLLSKSKSKNICLSGGFFNNVINNAKLQKDFGDEYNIFIDPICSDNGTSIGAAIAVDKYYGSTTQKYIENVYLGTKADYNVPFEYHDKIVKDVLPKDIAKLISERNVVALYQGQAEAGFRALGNRSLLYDPRDPNGQAFINKLKGREKFRPFAASVLYENAHEWFDMIGLHESPYMMYSLKCKDEREKLIPAVMHRDNTCRIQTVTEQTNKKYYELIQEFYNITGIPMVLNTSLNLAGDTIADNMKDAIDTCVKGGIQYLYCPEKNMIINFKR